MVVTMVDREIAQILKPFARSQRMRKGQPLLPQLDVKIYRSRGQGINDSVSSLACNLLA